MAKIKNLFNRIKKLFQDNILVSKKRISLGLTIIVALTFCIGWFLHSKNNQSVKYETVKVEKGTLITSINGSGTINSGNSTNITTKVSGVVKEVYATNGDTVEKGQKIALIELDEYALERQNAAWVDYLEAQEAVKDAEKSKSTADLNMWEARQDIMDAEEDIKYYKENPLNPITNERWTVNEKTIIDKTLEEAQKSYNAAEIKYKDADAKILDYNTKVSSKLRDYQENSAIIYAPTSGTISDLTLASNVVVAASSSTSNTSGATIISAQTVGKVNNPTGQIIATITLSEVDIISVKANQKVTMTLDAYPNVSFTGKILGVNTSGTLSSGVTSYPVTILLDKASVEIYPNMAVNATIITSIITDAIIIPTTAITIAENQSTVQIMKDGKPQTIIVETGKSNDSQTEIKSGINQGDEVITSIISTVKTNSSNNTTSPFSGVGRSSSSSNKSLQSGPPMGGF